MGGAAGAVYPFARAGRHDGDDDRVCTVVVRWSPDGPTRILALRDELTGRDFDDPAPWWPDLPDVIGGRDRAAGGTWCATRVTTGATALVLNRPEKPTADKGAPSRGVLPLLAAVHGAEWTASVDLAGMASFTLVLATSQRLTSWVFDGRDVAVTDHPGATHMFTSGGPENGKVEAFLSVFRDAGYPDGWRQLLRRGPPRDDPSALVVRHPTGNGREFAHCSASASRPNQAGCGWTAADRCEATNRGRPSPLADSERCLTASAAASARRCSVRRPRRDPR